MKDKILSGKRASSNWFRKQGLLLDLKEQSYKNYDKVMGFTFGEWKKLPKLNYILLFRTLYAKCEACTLDDFENENNGIYQLSFVYPKNRKLILHETKNKFEIFELAENLAVELHLPILDSASNRRKSVWLKLETTQVPVL